MAKNRNLLIIGLIALVNMLGYGIVIPLLYAYSKKFGLSDFENGLLFAAFSVCQFLSTPLIGRLSDKYGRRPLLLISLCGTFISFFMMAFAPSALFLVLARCLDGLTAGNIPVAFAVLSDSTKPEERAKAFGLLWAAFSFGFVFGPAIAAFTAGFGLSIPFIIAGLITGLAILLTAIYLPETNKHMGEVSHAKLFDFARLWHTLFDPNVGATLAITFVFFLAFSCAIIYGFQPFTMRVLHVSASENAVFFTIFGTVGLLAQTFFIQPLTKLFGIKKAFSTALVSISISFFIMFLSHSILLFLASMVILSFFNSTVQTLTSTIISQETDAKSQGSIMGLNTSYQSLGMIAGPILGGAVATVAPNLPFIIGSALALVCFWLSFKVLRSGVKQESAFGN